MNDNIFEKDEWTQEEYLKYKEKLQEDGVKIIFVDTILKPIDNVDYITYNPHEMSLMPKDKTVFLFYCDTGKTTKERLSFYRSKLEGFRCISLRGGRGYWRPNFRLLKK
ncbi:hypothetical protein [Arcobacter sp.]|uniref:hypothetical protein n=1 Tax=Arcobacter sp. TaxID=1872629 RepID=UPI003D0C348B